MKSAIISLVFLFCLSAVQAQTPVKWYTVERHLLLAKGAQENTNRCIYRLVQVV